MCNRNVKKWTNVICISAKINYEGTCANVLIKYIFVPNKKQQKFIQKHLSHIKTKNLPL